METEYISVERTGTRPPRSGRRTAPRRRRFRALGAAVLFALGFFTGCFVQRQAAVPTGIAGAATVGEGGAKMLTAGNVPESVALPDWIEERLLPVNEYSRCGEKLTQVNAVVIHYVGNPGTTAGQNRSYFENLATTGETSASSNLIVGLEGETLLCVPLNEVAYCSNSRNHDTVSVEFCHADDSGEPSRATYDALVRLTAWLCELYGLTPEEGVIRHYDVIGKECPRYFVRNGDAWAQFKRDVAAAMA